MKKTILTVIILSFLVTMLFTESAALNGNTADKGNNRYNKPEKMKVAVFNGFGASSGCITDTLEALKIDPAIQPMEISAAQILSGGLNNIDVLVLAGGSGSKQTGNLGHLAAEKVRDFAETKGKGIVGICAGAYMLSDTPDYACLNLFPVQAVDRVNDERGNGIIEFAVNPKGLEIFPELKNRKKHYIHYYEGPLCVPAKHNPKPYTVLSTIVSDVHLKGNAPAGMTPGKPLYLNAEIDGVRMFLSVAHPETTPGMRWMVPRMVRWVAKKELVPYPPEVVRPEIYSKEILFDKKLRKIQEDLFQQLLYGDSGEKIKAINKLVELHAWSARFRIPGLLRDNDPDVRLTAARALAEIEYTCAIDEIEATRSVERIEKYKKELTAILERLKRMIQK